MADVKILLVDDSEFFLELEKGFLQYTPATILTASSGLEALEIVSHDRPDLIYMDFSMPGMDGAACCARLKAHPLWQTIPVIMIFAPRSERDVEICKEAGCDEIITKPLDRRVFLETGRRFLDKIDRRDRRVPCRFMVVFRHQDESNYAMCSDLSTGGLYLGTEKAIRPEENLMLNFLLPGGDSQVIETGARVAWINKGVYRPKPTLPEGFGLEFQGLSEGPARLIRRYLDNILV